MKNSDKHHLLILKKIIDEKFNFSTEYLEPNELNSLDALVCVTPSFKKLIENVITFMFIPFEAEDQQKVKLLQIYNILPLENLNISDNKIKDILFYISNRTLIGNFSIENSKITYRYIFQVSEKMDILSSEFEITLNIYLSTLETFSMKLQEYINGSISADDFKDIFK